MGDREAEIAGCLRLTTHAGRVNVTDLRVNEFIERMSPRAAEAHREALRAFINEADRSGRVVCEPGGWAVHPGHRNGSKALVLDCACWALGQLLGGPVGVAFANTYSAAIFRRLGGLSLSGDVALLSVFDEYLHTREPRSWLYGGFYGLVPDLSG